jgi:DNA-binding NarL/FixJ family response regulator
MAAWGEDPVCDETPNPSSALAKRLRVVVCDDEALMRSALRLVLTPAEGLEIVGEATNGAEAMALVERTTPDIVLLDLRMPRLDGLRCLDRLQRMHPNVTTVVLSGADDEASIEAALRRGAARYVLKSINPVDLPAIIRQSVERSVFQPGSLAADGRSSAARKAGLSEKEAEVLAELARGVSNQEIARSLWLSEQTVKFHLRNIYRKLGVVNRTEAVRLAFDGHLVDAA